MSRIQVFPSKEEHAAEKWKLVCCLSWAVCFVYVILISIQPYLFRHPFCTIVPHDYGSYYSFACAAAVSGFFFTFMMLTVRIFHASPGSERIPSIIAWNIILVGFLSTLSFVAFNWNGVCVDALGVTTPAMMWSEWLSNGASIVFLTITFTGKKELTKADLGIIISFSVAMVSAFLPIIPQLKELAYMWVCGGLVCVLPTLYLPWYLSRQEAEAVVDIEEADYGYNQNLVNNRQKQQFYLAVWMTAICPLFAVNYFLAANKVIGPGESAGTFLLLTLVLKAFFAANLADAHIHSLLRNERDRVLFEFEKECYANEARRNFLKYLFHEVRTPLNSLTMGIELLQTTSVSGEAEVELLEMMKGAGDFMSDTLNNILSMQKIEDGKMDLIFAPFNMVGSVTKVMSAMSGAVMSKKMRLEKHIAADIPPLLLGDAYRVEHVISNLLSNAIKFSPEGSAILVNVSATAVTTAIPNIESSYRTSVTVSISDEGPGISADNQSQLFTGYFQVRPDQLQEGKGSGLGLALCKQIVTLHGGTIGVDSVEGKGSTFHFCIPFEVATVVLSKPEENKKGEDVELPPESNTNVFSSTVTMRSNNMSQIGSAEVTADLEFSPGVLVVDDVASNRKMLQALLKRNGAKYVDTAENGLEAVQVAQANAHKYDVIFMDNFMPVMCGVEAVRRLREDGFAHLVVGVTGNVLEDDVIEYLDAGADMVMGKPVKIDMLRMLLRHVKEHGNLSRPDMYLSEAEHDATLLEWNKKERLKHTDK